MIPSVDRVRPRGARPAVGAALALLLLSVPATGTAQPTPSRFGGTLALLNTQPLGELRTGPGLGASLAASWAVDPARRLRLRGEVRFSGYGSESRRACLSETVGCLIEVDIDTRYTALYAGAGPEVAVPLFGSTLVLDATAGVGRFAVDSSVRGISDRDDGHLSTNNFHDEFFAWSAGGELQVPVAPRFALAFGVHYQGNGEASYVREGGITTNPDGSLDVRALTTEANQVAITLGVAFRPFRD